MQKGRKIIPRRSPDINRWWKLKKAAIAKQKWIKKWNDEKRTAAMVLVEEASMVVANTENKNTPVTYKKSSRGEDEESTNNDKVEVVSV